MSDKPETSFRAGNVSGSIFVNEYEGKEILNISLQKSYKKKGSDEWQRTGNLGVNDIPKAQLVLQQAYEYSFSRKKPSNKSSEVEESTPF